MPISLKPETEKLIEERMRQAGLASADELVLVALDALDQVRAGDIDSLDAETRAALEEGLDQADRGKGRPWEEVREELRARFIRK